MLNSQHFNVYSNPSSMRHMWIAISVFFHIANIGTAYRIVSMGSANNEVKAKKNSGKQKNICYNHNIWSGYSRHKHWRLWRGDSRKLMGLVSRRRRRDREKRWWLHWWVPWIQHCWAQGKNGQDDEKICTGKQKKKMQGKITQKRQNRLGQDCLTLADVTYVKLTNLYPNCSTITNF